MLILKNTNKTIEECSLLINQNLLDFESYYHFLVEYNQKVNLTAITDKEEVFIKHFLDSILAIDKIAPNALVVDVGTGAGFPGLPIKLVRNDVSLTMVDSLSKRVTFLKQICKVLNTEANCVHSRVEDFAKTNRECFDVAVARAVARSNTLVEYLLPLVKVGGVVILYKGSNFEEELAEAEPAIEKLGGSVSEISTYTLPNNLGERAIIVIKKITPTPKQFPRGQNQPKLKPLK